MVPLMRVLQPVGKTVGSWVVKNSPKILFGAGVAGLIGTAISAAKSAPEANRRMDEIELNDEDGKLEELVKKAKVAAPVYAPSICMGVASVVCFGASNHILSVRQAAAAMAASVAQEAIDEFQSATMSEVGPRKFIKIRDDKAKKKLDESDFDEKIVEDTGHGNLLCFDAVTGRYFRSSTEAIRQAENTIVKWCADDTQVDLNSFYEELGLKPCKLGRKVGWRIDGTRPDIHFSSHLKGDIPVLVLDYVLDDRLRY